MAGIVRGLFRGARRSSKESAVDRGVGAERRDLAGADTEMARRPDRAVTMQRGRGRPAHAADAQHEITHLPI